MGEDFWQQFWQVEAKLVTDKLVSRILLEGQVFEDALRGQGVFRQKYPLYDASTRKRIAGLFLTINCHFRSPCRTLQLTIYHKHGKKAFSARVLGLDVEEGGVPRRHPSPKWCRCLRFEDFSGPHKQVNFRGQGIRFLESPAVGNLRLQDAASVRDILSEFLMEAQVRESAEVQQGPARPARPRFRRIEEFYFPKQWWEHD